MQVTYSLSSLHPTSPTFPQAFCQAVLTVCCTNLSFWGGSTPGWGEVLWKTESSTQWSWLVVRLSNWLQSNVSPPNSPVNYKKILLNPTLRSLFVRLRHIHFWNRKSQIIWPHYVAYSHHVIQPMATLLYGQQPVLKYQPECMILYNFTLFIQPVIPVIFVFPFLTVFTLI